MIFDTEGGLRNSGIILDEHTVVRPHPLHNNADRADSINHGLLLVTSSLITADLSVEGGGKVVVHACWSLL
jgi:hypothetical protein